MNTGWRMEAVKKEFTVLRFALCLFPLVMLVAFLLILDRQPIHDEIDHYLQIQKFIQGEWILQPGLTTIPGYHALIALLARITGWTSLTAARFFTLLLSLGSVGVFYLLARELCGRCDAVRTLQFGLIPILFPFFMLVYTDSVSQLFVLLMWYFTLTGRYSLGGLAGLASCLIRQNNIPWVVFASLLSYVDSHGWTWPAYGRDWLRLLGRYWLFLLTGALFVVFVIANGGVALGDEGSHPLNNIHLTNIFFLLFLVCIFFLPSWVTRWREMCALLRRKEIWVVLILLFFAFWFGFIVDHPYNTGYTDLFLRNAILAFFSSSGFLKFLFFIPVALVVLWLWVLPLRGNWWLLYPFTMLLLLPVWLVEQRYYLIPLSLFVLVREPESKAVEYAQLGLFAAVALTVFVTIDRSGWFL